MGIETTRKQTDRTNLETVIPLNTPYIISIDPSSACNFKCKFCYQSDKTNFRGIKGYPYIMELDEYKGLMKDIEEFPSKVKVVRLYGFGEPTLNRHFSEFVKLAKDNSNIEKVDTTTNGSKLTKEFAVEIIESGIDRINISVEGINRLQYREFSGVDFNFNIFVDNLAYLYYNKKQCEIFIKINGDILNDAEKKYFKEVFTPISDGIGIEHIMGCWNDFEVENINEDKGLYGQELKDIKVCPYIFYAMQVHANLDVSACFLDWNKKLIVGDASSDSLANIWNGEKFNNLRKFMLQGNRKAHSVCKDCGQLSHGDADNIDDYARELLKKF